MNKFRLTIVCIFIGATSLSINAGPRSRQQALTIAQEKAKELGIESSPALAHRSAAKLTTAENADAPYYVFNNGSNKGWTIVSGDDRMPEVLGYSDKGSIDMDNLPEALKDIFGSIENTYNNLDKQSASSSNKIMRKTATGTTNLPIGPLCETTWDQYEPYYRLTPTSDGTHCATCCVATAMAQILYYLYKTQGGQTSTTFTNSISSRVGSVDGPRTYEWSKMLADYKGADYTDEQANAVATLMRDCGYALDVNYNVSTSTAYSDMIKSVGAQYFGLDASSVSYTNYSDINAFFAAVDEELNTYHPVQVCGANHSYVCDGRDATGQYYHFNFGYSGGGNGFYCSDAYNGYASNMALSKGLRLAGDPTAPASATDKLKIVYNSAVAVASHQPVGDKPGFYQQKHYDALKTLTDKAEGVINGTTTMGDADILTLVNNIGEAEQTLTTYRTPYPNGRYYIKTYDKRGGSILGMYSYVSGGSVNTALRPFTPIAAYAWEFEYDESKNAYYIKNPNISKYLGTVPANFADPTYTDEKEIACEVIATDRIGDTDQYMVTIRPIGVGYKDDPDRYLGIYQDSGTGSSTAWVVGLDPYGDYSKWTLEVYKDAPEAYFAKSTISIKQRETTINELTTNSTGAVTYSSDNESIATVDANGNVTGTGVGTAIITAKIAETDNLAAGEVSYRVYVVANDELNAELKNLIATAKGLYTSEELETVQESANTEIEKSLDNLGKAVDTASAVTNAFQEDIDALNEAINQYKNSVPAGSSIKIEGVIPRYVVKQLNANDEITSIDLTGATKIFYNLRLNDGCEIVTGNEGVPATTLSYSLPEDNEWGTICVPFELISDDDIQYYKMGGSQTTGSNVIYFDPVDAVAANQPAVYKKSSDEFTMTSEEEEIVLNTNIAGSLSAIDNLKFTGTYKNLSITSGYYLANDTFCNAATSATSIKPYHAYFALVNPSAGPNVDSFSIVINTPTGIKNITAEITGKNIYSVTGVRLSKPAKGVNIIDGKKIIVK